MEDSMDQTLLDKKNNLNFLLIPKDSDQPFLLFRKQISEVTRINNFEELAKMVNFKIERKPTLYHQIDEEFPKTEELAVINHKMDNKNYIIQTQPKKLVGTFKKNKNVIIGKKKM